MGPIVTHERGARERLRKVDANLLLVLHAFIEDRSLTRAAERLAMSQSAVGGALTRLRKHFDDELLVRAGRGYELTPLVERLRPLVADAVEAAETLLGNQREFNAATSSRRFDVSMSEYAMTVLAEPLTRLLAEQAPGCTIDLDALNLDRDQVENQLMRRDLLIAPLGYEFPGRTQPVFTDTFVCLVARDHLLLRDGRLTLDDLLAMPHAVAEFIPAGDHPRHLELALRSHGLGMRTVLVRVTSLLTIPYAVAGTDMCGFIPARLARRCVDVLDLVIAETPIPPVSITEAAHWHVRREKDPALVWLRRLLHEVAVTVEDALD